MDIFAILSEVFGAEWAALSEVDRLAIAADAIDAATVDGCTSAQYRANIGAGNLQSYADCLRAGGR